MDSSELTVNDIVIPVFSESSCYINVEAREEIFVQYWVMPVENVLCLSCLLFQPLRTSSFIYGIILPQY